MADGADAVAVLDSAEPSQADISQEESTQSTVERQPEQQDRVDNRRQPDALRKHIADLRRQANEITDPAQKKEALDRIKLLYDTTGKARAYEEQFPTVREAREFKALLDAAGGREGIQQMQTVLADVEQIDAMLSAGDASVIDRMWEEAPQGMPKLVPHIADRFEKQNPQEYEQFIAPRAISHLDRSGFPQAFDAMVQAYEAGNKQQAQALRDQLIQWVAANRGQGRTEQRTDPEIERLRQENEQLRRGDESKQVDSAYNSVVDHAGPAIDAAARPEVAKFGLTKEEYAAFRSAVWDHLQQQRNADEVYKTVAPAKQRQGYDAWTDYAKRWTQDHAADSVRAVLKMPPWTRLQPTTGNGTRRPATAPVVAGVQTGKMPSREEIDYGPKGVAAARKAGFRDLQDMLLSGQAPLKAGGIRKFR